MENDLNAICSQIRRDIVRMVHAQSSGHPGGSLGCVEFLVALYFKIMNHDKNFKMDAIGEDVFFLSNGHISPVIYSFQTSGSEDCTNTYSATDFDNDRIGGGTDVVASLPIEITDDLTISRLKVNVDITHPCYWRTRGINSGTRSIRC